MTILIFKFVVLPLVVLGLLVLAGAVMFSKPTTKGPK
jgi:hypothetical protein